MEKIRILIKRTENGFDLPIPKYMTYGAAGMDLYAAVKDTEVIQPGEIKLVSSGISIALPEGYEAQIRPRSGLALKHGISMVNTPGTIDADYRGEIGLILINFGKLPYEIKRGERIAQMVMNKVVRAEFSEVDNLDETDRNSGGFGSTGK